MKKTIIPAKNQNKRALELVLPLLHNYPPPFAVEYIRELLATEAAADEKMSDEMRTDLQHFCIAVDKYRDACIHFAELHPEAFSRGMTK